MQVMQRSPSLAPEALLRACAVSACEASTSSGLCCIPGACTAAHESRQYSSLVVGQRKAGWGALRALTAAAVAVRAHPEGFLDAVRWGGPCSLSFAASYSGQAAAQPAASGPQVSFTLPADDPADPASRMTPKAVVERLDEYIIGQADAKKAVAVAFRNRWRRKRVPESIRDDIVPKNILLIGPTGCGKTEIARRLAKLAEAPFVKVEATKFTEVGYHGRDVDTIVRDLVEAALSLVKERARARAAEEIKKAVEARLVKALREAEPDGASEATVRERLQRGELEDKLVDIDVGQKLNLDLSGMGQQGMPVFINLEKLMASRSTTRTMKVRDARPALEEAEGERLLPQETLTKEAITLAEQDGIVFIDEIDKIVAGSGGRSWRGGDPSSEGVQRDLLPIIEGSIVNTKHGNVNTDHVLFVCAGAFHSAKPSDLMAELQGRLPIRVELSALTQNDLYRILTEPAFNLVKQQQSLLAAEGVDLVLTDAALKEIARAAEHINKNIDNIGARRLHALIERIVEEVSFSAPELVALAKAAGQERHVCVVDKEDVAARLAELMQAKDLSKYII